MSKRRSRFRMAAAPEGGSPPQQADLELVARREERKYVHEVYDAIAGSFSATRAGTWPGIRAFLGALPAGSLVLDAGCGNGRYMSLAPLSGAGDLCRPLAELAAENHLPGVPPNEVAVAHSLALPHRAGLFDACISIAVIHHFMTTQRRIASILEMARVLGIGGVGLVTAWALPGSRPGTCPGCSDTSAGSRAGFRALFASSCPGLERPMPATGPVLCHICAEARQAAPTEPIIENEQDLLVGWQLPREAPHAQQPPQKQSPASDRDLTRYYHFFREFELENLVQMASMQLAASTTGAESLHIRSVGWEKENWSIVFEKVRHSEPTHN
ncbi:hypothetical protein H696_01504 [Fonticula alba]|uniref:Methyltransferase type 11 domain-containing protein n=1 Tax=Fonticula alba TaxID=691883 RepID=A0A058ZF35_FONAL|nr:hypothetical protein H696_01504 [Fonticula alba]KCV72097.1 hypothetical protein H696_01504 [Fonticula alba]|eukprot:XP_009493675.1 hypothetical protein H696_01504 [Fonticula alba]